MLDSVFNEPADLQPTAILKKGVRLGLLPGSFMKIKRL